MEIRVLLSVTLSVLLLTINAAAAASFYTHHLEPANSQEESSKDFSLAPALPRKLIMVTNEAEGHDTAKYLVSSNVQNKASSGKKEKGEDAAKVKVDAAKGTRQAWMERSSDEFFTMDYSHVKRRSPIHNKSFPKSAVTNSP